jgi:replicative DNA helicase
MTEQYQKLDSEQCDGDGSYPMHDHENDIALAVGNMIPTKSYISYAITGVQSEKLDMNTFLDTDEKIISNYSHDHPKISFAGDNLKDLQEKMGGGLLGGKLYALGGIPGCGKTLLMNNMTDNISLNGYPVLFLTLDSSMEDLRNMTNARFSDFTMDQFSRTMKSEDVQNLLLNENIQKIMPLKYMVEFPACIENWDYYMEQIKESHGQYPVIMIDAYRKIRIEKEIIEERLRIDYILFELTSIAKKYQVPVFLTSQLARESYKFNHCIGMGSLKESGSIEYESAWVGVMGIFDRNNGDDKLMKGWESRIGYGNFNIDLKILKSNKGTGEAWNISFKVNRKKMIIFDRQTEAGRANDLSSQPIFDIPNKKDEKGKGKIVSITEF